MNTPTNNDNFLIEVTPEVMSEINHIWMNAETEPIVQLHYSPYWKPSGNEEA